MQEHDRRQCFQPFYEDQGPCFLLHEAPPHRPRTPPSKPDLKFYKGGQFTPGEGRAPRGGCWMPPPPSSPPTVGRKFYKGGQFTPGGGRAPKGGCWK